MCLTYVALSVLVRSSTSFVRSYLFTALTVLLPQVTCWRARPSRARQVATGALLGPATPRRVSHLGHVPGGHSRQVGRRFWGLAVEQGGFEGVFAASARGVRYGSRCAQERGCGDKVSGST